MKPRFEWGDIGPNAHATAHRIAAHFEGLALVAYQCGAGVWSLGHGHTSGIVEGMTCTKAQAADWLAADMQHAFNVLDLHVVVPLTKNQRAALASFVFNVGPGRKGVKDGFVTLKNGNRSTMLTRLNSGSYLAAADELPKWNLVAGKVSRGIVRRRAAERALFMTPD
jgi:lysozyme